VAENATLQSDNQETDPVGRHLLELQSESSWLESLCGDLFDLILEFRLAQFPGRPGLYDPRQNLVNGRTNVVFSGWYQCGFHRAHPRYAGLRTPQWEICERKFSSNTAVDRELIETCSEFGAVAMVSLPM
jgi:hypothetical protein